MELSKDYLYNREKIVLLVCDFYETLEIPNSIFEIKDNLALFPVANIPLIEYILTNLYDQNFKNVIITGKNIDSIIKYIKSTKFLSYMNIRTLKCNGTSLGDIFREIDCFGYDIGDVAVMYANHFTNIPLAKLFKKHKKSKDTALTLFVHNRDTNDINTHVYVTKDNQIVFYEKLKEGTINADEIEHCAKKYKAVDVSTCFSAPTFAIVSKPVFTMFTENFDFATLGDLLIGIFASGIYGYKFNIISQGEIETIHKEKMQIASTYSEFVEGDSYSSVYTEALYTSSAPEQIYSREINTLLDYFHLNNDVIQMSASIFRLQKVPEFLQGKTNFCKKVQNSVVGPWSKIEGSLSNCVVWENCHVIDDVSNLIIFDNERVFDLTHLESELTQESNETKFKEDEKKNETFFDDFSAYLTSCITEKDLMNINLDDVFKQISLLRIVWNASKQEVIEAFAFFFIDCLDLNNLEETISKASIFFGILEEFVETYEDQDLLMECMHLNMHDLPSDQKTQIFFNYLYIFVESDIVDKSIAKKYNKMHKAGLF